MNHQWTCLVFTLFTLSISAAGQSPVPGQDASVASLFGEYTLAVARLDPGRLDTAGAMETLSRLVGGDDRPEWEQEAREAGAQLDAFKERWQACGLNELYIAFDLDDLGRRPPIFAAAAGNALLRPDAREIVSSFIPGSDRAASAGIGGISVMADPLTLERLKDPNRRADPRWAGVLENMAPGVLQVAVKPYAGWERVLQELLPILPEVAGGGPSTALTRGLTLARVTLDAPPNLSLRVDVQSQSRTDAEALRQVILAGLDALGTNQAFRNDVPNWDEIRAAFVPTVNDRGLAIALDGPQLEELARGSGAALFSESREKALRVKSMVNLRQIGLAFFLYANEHDENLPEHLVQLLPYLGGVESLLNPRAQANLPDNFGTLPDPRQRAWIDEHAGYTYVNPGMKLRDISYPSRLVLVHEQLGLEPPGGGVAAVFGDGHVEVMASVSELEARLNQGTEP